MLGVLSLNCWKTLTFVTHPAATDHVMDASQKMGIVARYIGTVSDSTASVGWMRKDAFEIGAFGHVELERLELSRGVL